MEEMMPAINYNHVIAEIKELNLADQLRLLEDVAGLIRKKTIREHSRSIMELQGKGKQLWNNLDIKKYIDEERSSWNG